MLAHTLRIHVADWQDGDFVHAFEAALMRARARHADASGASVASQVQTDLRVGGYRHARVEHVPAVDDVLSGVAHWTVRRGSPSDPSR